MVGSTSKQLEPSICASIEPQQQQHNSLEDDISQYLLLHHDYAAKPETEPKRSKRRKMKEIRPKTQKPVVLQPTVQTTTDGQEVLYGTYDQDTNCITILVNGEATPLSEPITEVITTIPETTAITQQLLTVPEMKNPSSPGVHSDSSDCGYESYDSPHSVEEADDDDRLKEFSELFPALLY